MSLSLNELSGLPSPFYRVAVKALIFEDNHQLLVALNETGQYEIPGGGWEHNESLEECLQRELDEEVGARLVTVDSLAFTFQSQSKHGYHVLRLVVRAEIENRELKPGDDMVDARFVSKDEFLELDFDPADAPIKKYVSQIWS